MHVSPLTPDTFFLYMLPPIILDAGYFMPNRLFFDHLGTILLFAVVGTIYNTLTIENPKQIFTNMFLFSALISAVDPVAVLAVFEEIHVNEILYIVVFGESLLNDAVTVVLYHMFEAYTEMGPSNIMYTDLLSGLASFFVVALGGTFIGVIWGFLTGLVTRYTHEDHVLRYNDEELRGSQYLTQVPYNCEIRHENVEQLFRDHHLHVPRRVIFLTAIANRFRLHKLNKVEKFVMSYGGLRGAVAFALVLLIDKDHVKLQPMFVTTTIAVIYFTVFFQGITIKPLVKVLNVKRAEKRKPTMNERIHERRFDNKFIRPLLLRDYTGAEPKILETYSKLAMKDAMEYMRRNASTIGNISGTESMSAIFRNYTAGNINGNLSGTLNGSFSQLDSSTWNIDMQELEYNPSKKDLTDARIHHLLAEELCKPYRRHRRLSYSRHAVNDRDLSTQPVNYRMHMNIRRMVGERKHHHKRSKRLGKDGKQNHVSFPGITQNGSAKQFSHDYINEVLQESENDGDGTKSTSKEDWDSAITFTAKTSPGGTPEANVLTQITSLPGSNPRKARLIKQYSKPNVDYDDAPTVAEVSLPWRRGVNGATGTNAATGECARVTTPTATETMLPWKRDDEGESTCPLKQSEFPAWCSNKEYLAYSSPSATFLGGIEQPKIASVIGLFRRESSGSVQDSRASSESSLQHISGPESPPAPGAVLLIEEGGPEPLTGMLGVPRRPPVGRRGSMLELGSTTVNSIPEEEALTGGATTPLTSPQNSPTSSLNDQRWMALGKGSGSLSRLAGRLSALASSSSSSSSSSESSNEEEEEEDEEEDDDDEKRAINRTQE
ncbi:hypothetical protein C0J52_19028 [Blattella germanica]|nr:hypothetical protein C0J52_19028 [Blattella germanica]